MGQGGFAVGPGIEPAVLSNPARHVDGQVAGGATQKCGHDFGGGQRLTGIGGFQVVTIARRAKHPMYRVQPQIVAESKAQSKASSFSKVPMPQHPMVLSLLAIQQRSDPSAVGEAKASGRWLVQTGYCHGPPQVVD